MNKVLSLFCFLVCFSARAYINSIPPKGGGGFSVIYPVIDCSGYGVPLNFSYSGQVYYTDSNGNKHTINVSGSGELNDPGNIAIYSEFPAFPPVGEDVNVTITPNNQATGFPSQSAQEVGGTYLTLGNNYLGENFVPGAGPFAYWGNPSNPCNNNRVNFGGSAPLNNAEAVSVNDSGSPEIGPNGQVLEPGQSATNFVSFPLNSSGTISWTNMDSFNGSWDGAPYTINFSNSNGSILGISTNYPVVNSANSDFLAYSNGGPIEWTPDMSTNPNGISEAGFNGVINALNADQLANQLWGSNFMNGLTNPAARNVNVVNSNFNFGATSVWVMNFPAQQGVTNPYFAYLAGLTNLTGANAPATNVPDSGSNVWVMNWPTSSVTIGSQIFTNAGGWTNDAAALYADGGLASFISSMAPTIPDDSDGDTSGFQMSFCGFSLNFDPYSRWPWLFDLCRIGWVLAVTVWFLRWLAEKYWEMVMARPLLRGRLVPNMDTAIQGELFGTGGSIGGNAIGMIVWWVCQAIFVGIWVGLNVWFFGHMTGAITSSIPGGLSAAVNVASWLNILNEAGESGAMALHIIYISMPLNWIMTFVFSRISLTFTMAGAIDFAAFVCSRLPVN